MISVCVEESGQGTLAQVRIKPLRYLADRWGIYQAAIRGAVFDPRKKSHLVPRHAWPKIARSLHDAGFELQYDLYADHWVKEEAERSLQLCESACERLVTLEPKLARAGKSLRAYQRVGVEWLSNCHAGLLLDEQGTGKTIQALCAIPCHAAVIVVCPASLRGLWRDEIHAWREDLTAKIEVGSQVKDWPKPGQVLIVSDGSLRVMSTWPAVENLYLIADECHAYKGRSKRTEAMQLLAANVRRGGGWTIGLTGTPLLNRPAELYTIALVFGCARLAFRSWTEYTSLWNCRKGRFGELVWGKAEPEVREFLARVSLRRTRAEVMPELPEKTYQVLPVDLSPLLMKEMNLAWAEDREKIEAWASSDKPPSFEHHSKWRANLAKAKMDSMLEWVKRQEEAQEPCLVFSMHLCPILALGSRPGWKVITGETHPEERTNIVRSFQQGELKGVGLTVRAGGVGITLTRAAFVLFVDESYTPADNAQAEDRACRYGQKRAVQVTYLVAEHPLDKRIHQILRAKQKMIDSVLTKVDR